MNFSKKLHRPCGNINTACHINVPKKDGGISIVAKSVSQSERFFDNHYKADFKEHWHPKL